MELTLTKIVVLAGSLALFVGISVLAYALLAVNCHDRDDKHIYELEIKNKALRASKKTTKGTLVDSNKKIEPCPVSRPNSGISIADYTGKKTINHNSAGKRRLKW